MDIVLPVPVSLVHVLDERAVIQNPSLYFQAILSVHLTKRVTIILVVIQIRQTLCSVSSEFEMLSHKKMEPWKQEKNIPPQ